MSTVASEKPPVEQTITTPSGEHNTDRLTTDVQQPEKKWYQRNNIRIALGGVAAGAVFLGGILIGNGGSNETDNNAPPNTEPGASAPIDPTEVPVEVPVPELVQRLEALSPEEFIAQPREQQLAYAFYNMEQNRQVYEDVFRGFPERHSTYTPASENNSQYEIINNLNYQYQMSYINGVTEPDPNVTGIVEGVFSADEGHKLLSGLYDANSMTASTVMSLHQYQELWNGQGVASSPRFLEPADPNHRGISNYECKDGVGHVTTCRGISVRLPDHIPTERYTAVLTPFIDVYGAPQQAWLLRA